MIVNYNSNKIATFQTLYPSKIERNNSETYMKIHQQNEIPHFESENFWENVKGWTGIRGLQAGLKNMKSGNYLRGFSEIALGSVRIALIAYTTFFVVQQIMNSFNKIPNPTLEKYPHGKYLDSGSETENFERVIEIPNPILEKYPHDKYLDSGSETENFERVIEIPNPILEKYPHDKYLDSGSKTKNFERVIEIPGVEKSQIQSETFNKAVGSRKITLITAYDEGIKDYAQYVIPNQRAFAAKHGYDYIEYYGNLAHDQGHQRTPYWSKIVAIHDQLQKTNEGEWIAWGDASALFTNTKKNFDQVIEKHGMDKDIILTTDPQVPINNAVFLVKNTPWTKDWINQVWARSDLAKGGEGNCWSWGQPFCHYEQQAITELWQRNSEVQSHTAIIPNKEMNAFYRYSHYDVYRKMYQNYDGDLESSKWTPDDFICKVTGMDKGRRLEIIKHVSKNCVDQKCDKIQP